MQMKKMWVATNEKSCPEGEAKILKEKYDESIASREWDAGPEGGFEGL